VIEFLIAGGPVMVPIGLVSVVALAAFLERLWALRRSAVCPGDLVEAVLEELGAGSLAAASARCAAHPTSVGRLLAVTIQVAPQGRDRLREKLEEVGRREAAELERYTAVIGTCAAVAPLLGLLGTVQGMIQTFAVVSEGGIANMQSLAGGISVALVTTFAGLCVGIPALIADRYVLSRVDALVLDLEAAASAASDLLLAGAPSGAAADLGADAEGATP
jgi:biopolymer transport protein ExbB